MPFLLNDKRTVDSHYLLRNSAKLEADRNQYMKVNFSNETLKGYDNSLAIVLIRPTPLTKTFKSDEERTSFVLESWKYILQCFDFPLIWARIGYSVFSFFVITPYLKQECKNTFEKIMFHWEQSENHRNLWKFSYLDLNTLKAEMQEWSDFSMKTDKYFQYKGNERLVKIEKNSLDFLDSGTHYSNE